MDGASQSVSAPTGADQSKPIPDRAPRVRNDYLGVQRHCKSRDPARYALAQPASGARNRIAL